MMYMYMYMHIPSQDPMKPLALEQLSKSESILAKSFRDLEPGLQKRDIQGSFKGVWGSLWVDIRQVES